MDRTIKQTIKNVTVSATALRRMANALQKARNTKGDVKVTATIEIYPNKIKTIGIMIDKEV